jgi:hypothetical protein
MNDAIRSTWAPRDLPILRAALRRMDAGEAAPELEAIREELGFSGDELYAGIGALQSADPPYIDVQPGTRREDYAGGLVGAVSERARRELGAWPSAESLVDALAAAFAQAAEAEKEPERRAGCVPSRTGSGVQRGT